MMRRIAALVFVLLLVMAGTAFADQDVQLKGTRYTLTLPDGMKYSPQNQTDHNQSPYFQYAYFSSALEMDVFMYDNGGVTLRSLSESMKAKGYTVTIQSVNGMELLCYTGVSDAADGADCIGYVLMDGSQAIEIAFWYATQDAMNQSADIINSIR